jgi:hypothetical protein
VRTAPKSTSAGAPSGRRITFAGLMSRCSTGGDAGVQVLEDVEQAEHQPQQRGRVEAGALRDSLLERRARDVLHDQVHEHHAVRGLVQVIEDLRDPVVPQRPQRRRLALEQLERLPAALSLGVELLERDLAIARGRVDRQVRAPERPAPERPLHAISPRHQVPRREGANRARWGRCEAVDGHSRAYHHRRPSRRSPRRLASRCHGAARMVAWCSTSPNCATSARSRGSAA